MMIGFRIVHFMFLVMLILVPFCLADAEEACINPLTGEPDTKVECFADPCSVSSCEGYPEAVCESNYCGGCHALWSDEEGKPVDCDQDCINPLTGEPDTEYNCYVDPCSVATCDGNPFAICHANYCGGCHAIWENEEGKTVDCEEDCMFGCTRQYDPVCASNGISYANECEMSRAACLLRENLEAECHGSCPCDRDCPDFCTSDYLPVCGDDGVTYSNECELQKTSCNLPDSRIRPVCYGECPCAGDARERRHGRRRHDGSSSDRFEDEE